MKNLIAWLNPQILFDIYDAYVAKSRSKPWLVRADGLNRVDYEAMMQAGYGEELLENLRAGKFNWVPNLLTKIEKDDGSLRNIEIPAHDVHLLSAALLHKYQDKTRLPNSFYCRRRIDFDDEVGVQTAIRRAKEVTHGKPVITLDIVDFFGSIRHDAIKSALEGIWHPEDIELAIKLVTLPTINENGQKISNPRRQNGIGICQGNPLSPLLAQFTSSDVPKIIEPLVEAQIWYVDDLLIVPDDVSRVERIGDTIRRELDPRGLALQPHEVKDALYLPDETFVFLKEEFHTLGGKTSTSRPGGQDREVYLPRVGHDQPTQPGPEGQGEGGDPASTLSSPTPGPGGTGKGDSPHREKDLIPRDYEAYLANRNHHTAQPVNGRLRSPCVERDMPTDLDQGSGRMGYQSPSLRDFDGVEEWIDRAVDLTATIRRMDKKILLEIDGGLGASPDKFDRIYQGSTEGGFLDLPSPDDHADVLLVDFGFEEEMRWKWKRHQKTVRSTLGTVFNSWCTSGATVIARFDLDDIYGIAAAEEISTQRWERLHNWTLDFESSPDSHLLAWHKSVTPDVLRRLKESPWIAVRRLKDGTHHVEDHKGSKFVSLGSKLMNGLQPRRRAAMYSAVDDAVEAARSRGEEELVILHCGDFQPGFFLDGWNARVAYLAEPIRRLKKRFSTFRRVDIVPMCKNSSRGLWAMARTLSGGDSA